MDEAATEFLDSDDAAGKYAWYEHIQDIDTGRFQSQNKSAELQKASIESNFFGKLMSGHADKPEIQRHLPTILFLSHQLYNIESLSDKTKGECYLKILNLSEVIAGAVFSDIEDKGLQKNLINYLKHNIIYFAASLAHNSRSIGNKALRQTGYGVFVGVNSFVLKAESQAIVNHFSAGETSIVSMLSEFPIELAAGLLIGTPTLALGILAGMGLHKLARYYDGQPSGVNSVNSRSQAHVTQYYQNEVYIRGKTLDLAQSMAVIPAHDYSSSSSSHNERAFPTEGRIEGNASEILRRLNELSAQYPLLTFIATSASRDANPRYQVVYRAVASLSDVTTDGELIFPLSRKDMEDAGAELQATREVLAGHQVDDADESRERRDLVDDEKATRRSVVSFSSSQHPASLKEPLMNPASGDL